MCMCFVGFICGSGVLFCPQPAEAFYAWQQGDKSVNLHGFGGLAVSYARNPTPNALYTERDDVNWGGDLRIIGEARSADVFFFEANVHQSVSSLPDTVFSQHLSSPSAVERSALFSWEQHASGNSSGTLEIDTLNGRWGNDTIEVIGGRQPVNLATNFYFSPNDFFAPFAAQTFFRVYKPGVDAVRCEMRIDNLSQFSMVGVLGYGRDATSGNGWTTDPDWDRTSFVGRFATNYAGFEWALLGGTVREHTVAGVSLQGEFFDWLGFRAEGHYADPENSTAVSGTEISLGLEHQFANSLSVRMEQYYHGQGYASTDEVRNAYNANTLRPGLMGRKYSAVGFSYEFSPLLFGDFVYLKNWTDHSGLWVANFVYSLADDAEFVSGINLPSGDEPDGSDIHSEYGSMPTVVSCEVRIYF